MHFERLKTSEGPLYTQAMALYKMSFPYHEQRKPASQAEIMRHAEYQFLLICDQDKRVGILLCWETQDFIYVEHFSIHPEMRSQGYGQRALELLKQRKKTIILEIDPPADAVSISRKAFYARAGFQVNAFAHKHPPYHKELNAHALIVLSYSERLTKAEYDVFDRYLRETVMRF